MKAAAVIFLLIFTAADTSILRRTVRGGRRVYLGKNPWLVKGKNCGSQEMLGKVNPVQWMDRVSPPQT